MIEMICILSPLSHKKYCGISKTCFILKEQSVTLDFELSYNEWTLGVEGSVKS